MADEAAGFALAYDTWVSQGSGLKSDRRGTMRYNKGPMRGKTRDEALAMFRNQVWNNAAPQWKDEYARRATTGMLSPSEQAESQRRQSAIRTMVPPRPASSATTTPAPATPAAPAPAPAQAGGKIVNTGGGETPEQVKERVYRQSQMPVRTDEQTPEDKARRDLIGTNNRGTVSSVTPPVQGKPIANSDITPFVQPTSTLGQPMSAPTGAASTIAPSKPASPQAQATLAAAQQRVGARAEAARQAGSVTGMDGKPIPMATTAAAGGIPTLPQPAPGAPIPVLPVTPPTPAPVSSNIERPATTAAITTPQAQPGGMPSRGPMLQGQVAAGTPIGAPRATPVTAPKPPVTAPVPVNTQQPVGTQTNDVLSNEDMSGQGYTLIGSKGGVKKWRRGADMNAASTRAAASTTANVVKSPVFNSRPDAPQNAPKPAPFTTKFDVTQGRVVATGGTPDADFQKYDAAQQRYKDGAQTAEDSGTVNDYIAKDVLSRTPAQIAQQKADERAGNYQAGRYVGSNRATAVRTPMFRR
jgi:hypothetical protein